MIKLLIARKDECDGILIFQLLQFCFKFDKKSIMFPSLCGDICLKIGEAGSLKVNSTGRDPWVTIRKS